MLTALGPIQRPDSEGLKGQCRGSCFVVVCGFEAFSPCGGRFFLCGCKLCEENPVRVQFGDNGRRDLPARMDVALPVHAANDSAPAKGIAAGKDGVRAIRCDFRQNQCPCPAYGRMAGRIGKGAPVDLSYGFCNPEIGQWAT